MMMEMSIGVMDCISITSHYSRNQTDWDRHRRSEISSGRRASAGRDSYCKRSLREISKNCFAEGARCRRKVA